MAAVSQYQESRLLHPGSLQRTADGSKGRSACKTGQIPIARTTCETRIHLPWATNEFTLQQNREGRVEKRRNASDFGEAL